MRCLKETKESLFGVFLRLMEVFCWCDGAEDASLGSLASLPRPLRVPWRPSHVPRVSPGVAVAAMPTQGPAAGGGDPWGAAAAANSCNTRARQHLLFVNQL